MTRTVSTPIAEHALRLAIAKAFAWTRKRASRPVATGGTR